MFNKLLGAVGTVLLVLLAIEHWEVTMGTAVLMGVVVLGLTVSKLRELD